MKFSIADILITKETVSYRQLRMGLLFGVLVYLLFSILDVFAAPLHYQLIWLIRFLVVLPVILLALFAHKDWIHKSSRYWLPILTILAQMGIAAMILLMDRSEMAYYSYYAGLILMILWGSFVFQLSTSLVLFISILNLLLYNLVAIVFQGHLAHSIHSAEVASLINNNFFLAASSLFTVMGAYQINTYRERLRERNKQLETEKEELQIAKEKAEASDRLKTIFLSNMSHEIRTPMNAILGFTELMNQPDTTEEQNEEFHTIIRQKGDELLQLINDIFDSAKIEAGELKLEYQACDLSGLLKDLLLKYRHILKRKHKLNQLEISVCNRLSSAENEVILDEVRLRQILENLLNNAIKFTESGKIILTVRKQAHELRFSVSDTGMGIPPEKQEVIFERFRQADEGFNRTYGGTGIGLSLVKNLVELHHGRVEVESRIGKGSVFSFTLPFEAATDMPEMANTHVVNDEVNPLRNKSILVVEDDETNFILLREILQAEDLDITHAVHGKEALEIFSKKYFDLILMDIKLPVMDGYEATREIRKTDTEIPIIAVTAYAMADEKAQILSSGFNSYLSKPIDISSLIAKLHQHLAPASTKRETL